MLYQWESWVKILTSEDICEEELINEPIFEDVINEAHVGEVVESTTEETRGEPKNKADDVTAKGAGYMGSSYENLYAGCQVRWALQGAWGHSLHRNDGGGSSDGTVSFGPV